MTCSRTQRLRTARTQCQHGQRHHTGCTCTVAGRAEGMQGLASGALALRSQGEGPQLLKALIEGPIH